jgi:hypothetical protein
MGKAGAATRDKTFLALRIAERAGRSSSSFFFTLFALCLGLLTIPVLAQTVTARYGHHGAVYLPDDRITPGVIRTTNQKEICDPKFRSAPFRLTTQAMKNEVYKAYGVQRNAGVCKGGCEVDHRVPLELGGLDDVKNLWPQPSQPVPGFHEKDKLENYLKHAVCIDKKMPLADAQKALMGDWYVAYLGAHLGPAKKSESAYPNDGGELRAALTER